MAKKLTLEKETEIVNSLKGLNNPKPIHFDDQLGCQAQNDLPATDRAISDYTKDLQDANSKLTAAIENAASLVEEFEPTVYNGSLADKVPGANQQSSPGILPEVDTGYKTFIKCRYRTARALIISGTIIYTIHRGLFEFLTWVLVKR
jgi:hypothetical protein